MINPRPYQTDCLTAILDIFTKGITRQLVSLPTGTGKTVVFALLAKQMQKRTLVIAHSEELIGQAAAKFRLIWPEVSIGIVQAGSDQVDAQVVIASIQTAHRDKRLRSLTSQGFELIIIDEAHHSAAPTYRKVLTDLGFLNGDPKKLLLGVTATPRRGDGLGLGSIFEAITFSRSMNTMIRSGYLSPLFGRRIVTRTDLRSVGMSRGDFITCELSKAINTKERNNLIVENFQAFANDRSKAIAFCADVKHAKDLSDVFSVHGIPSAVIYGNMDKVDRKRVLQDFVNGRFKVLTNCQVLTEGFDCEEIDCVILARPTASAPLYVQMVGRGTRIHPSKKDCLILDFCDNSTRHNLCNFKNTLDGSIGVLEAQECDDLVDECAMMGDVVLGENRPVASIGVFAERIEDIEFFGRSEFAWVSVGDSWHLTLTNDRDIWLRRDGDGFRVVAQSCGIVLSLSAAPLPLNYAMGTAEDWAREQTTQNAWSRKNAEWRSKPPTEKQLEKMKKYGLPTNLNMTRGQAASILDQKFNEPATARQKFFLKSQGIRINETLSKSQAGKLISSIVTAIKGN